MKTLDPHKLFNTFRQDPREVVDLPQEDYTFTQLNFIVSEVKAFSITDRTYISKNNKQYIKARKGLRHKLFISLVNEIQSIDKQDLKTLVKNGDHTVIDNLVEVFELLLSYFEIIEQYERCAIILPYLNIIK